MVQPQQYGPQPTQGQYPQQPAPTNGTAIAALIFSLLFAPVGLILAYIAKSQIKRTGQGGSGLATAALIIGWVFTAPVIIFTVLLLVNILVPSAQIF